MPFCIEYAFEPLEGIWVNIIGFFKFVTTR